MLATVLSVLLGLFQATPTGAVIAVPKAGEGLRPGQTIRIVLLPSKYTEIWNKQVQTRLDNYWEIYKPEFAVHKERFLEFERMAQLESFRYITSNLRRDLGDSASRLMAESGAGPFEFTGLPLGTYQLLAEISTDGQSVKAVIWSKSVDIRNEVPIFIELGKPVS